MIYTRYVTNTHTHTCTHTHTHTYTHTHMHTHAHTHIHTHTHTHTCTRTQAELLQWFYETTLEALQDAKNDRLWFKTNTKVRKNNTFSLSS